MKILTVLLIAFFTTSLFAMDIMERQHKFHVIMDKAKTPEAQIKKAELIAKDKKSPFRIDAINYLISKNSVSSGTLMVELSRDREVREFAIYGVGELGIYQATPYLIRYLNDDSSNVRGNAYRAMQKLYPREFNFEYHYDDAPYIRSKVIKNVNAWWEENRERFKNRNMEQKSVAEKADAQAQWDKYARAYLDRTQ